MYEYLNHINNLLKNYRPGDKILSHFVAVNGELVKHFQQNGFTNTKKNTKFLSQLKNVKVGGAKVDEEMVKNIDYLAGLVAGLDNGSGSDTCYGYKVKQTDLTLNDYMDELTRVFDELIGAEYFGPKLGALDDPVPVDFIKNKSAVFNLLTSVNDHARFILTRAKTAIDSGTGKASALRKAIQDILNSVILLNTSLDVLYYKTKYVNHAVNDLNQLVTDVADHTKQIKIGSQDSKKVIELLLGYINTLHSMVTDDTLGNLKAQLETMQHLFDTQLSITSVSIPPIATP